MSISTRNHLDAIEHLPEGATLILQNCTWDDYERTLKNLEHRPKLRVTYDRGRLEIMSPLNEHEGYARLIDDLVRAFADHFDILLEKVGSTTWSRRDLEQGVEADCCYYTANAARIVGKRRLELATDPPPDIAVEIDVTNESLSKFHIYAALSVPEIWRYDGMRMQFYELSGESYCEIVESRGLPSLKAAMLAEALEESKKVGQTDALHAFRQRLI